MPGLFDALKGQLLRSHAGFLPVYRTEVARVTWATPAALSVVAVLPATALAVGAVTVVTAGITNPDVPRALRIVGNAAGIVGSVVIEGTDVAGNPITDTLVANATTAVDGTKAFRTVTKITLPQRVTAGDTISVGYCNKLGLPFKLPRNTVLHAYLNNTREGTAPTVAVSATVLASNVVTLNTVLNGTRVDVYLLTP